MKVTVTTLEGGFFPLEVANDLELENFKALLEFEANIPATEMAILWNGQMLPDNKKTLKDYGIGDGEVLLLQRTRNNRPAQQQQAGMGIDFSAIQIPGTSTQAGPSRAPAPRQQQQMPDDPDTIREMLLSNPHELSILKERNPPLAEALLSGNKEKFAEVLKKQQKERADKERDRIRLLTADPFDASAQQAIAEEIRMKNVDSNMEAAMEYSPESFGQVVMLYIDCIVNNHAVKAFVDSGAQMTIMSQACAERCNIMRLVDRRWAGVAKGVGTQKIIGRVHLGQIKIGDVFLQSSFSILEDQPMDMLLGLDMLKRHQCQIDLKNNKLIIGTTGTETSFLPESELPPHARLNRNESATEHEDEDRQLAQALAKSAEDSGTASTAGQSSASSQSTPGVTSIPESQIGTLMQYGFPREQVVEELRKSGGNVDAALAALFAKSLVPPK